MARSAKPRKQKSGRQSPAQPPGCNGGGPCAGGPDNEAGLFFPDFGSAADYCMEKDIPYLFEEDVTGNYETTVWIVGEPDGNVTMIPMHWKNFLSVCTIHPFICPEYGSSHLPPA
ncbi:transposase [Escherichia coli]|nr:transposase [Escherichia coli]EIW3128973.1 transposase [Escherichia coli]